MKTLHVELAISAISNLLIFNKVSCQDSKQHYRSMKRESSYIALIINQLVCIGNHMYLHVIKE